MLNKGVGIEYCRDPYDMWSGEIKPIDYVDHPASNVPPKAKTESETVDFTE